MENNQVNKEELSYHKLTFGGASGAMFIAIVQLSSVQQLDLAQYITVFCFSIALPVFIIHFMNIEGSLIKNKFHRVGSANKGLLAIALISGVVGFIALFWHFHWLSGVVSFCMGVLFITSESKK